MSQEIDFTEAAWQNIEETGCQPQRDLADVRAGKWTRETLLAHCLDGADADRERGWRDYVDALFEVA